MFKLYMLLPYCALTINSNIKIEKYIDFSNNQFFCDKKNKAVVFQAAYLEV